VMHPMLVVLLSLAVTTPPACGLFQLPKSPMSQTTHGVNLVQSQNARLGSAAARASLERVRDLGANTVAIAPFLYQEKPTDPRVIVGDAVSDAELVAGIRAARALGLRVWLKPHIWIPGHWAGEVRMDNARAWQQWFATYSPLVLHYAALAQREGVERFSVGVELEQSIDRPEWTALITAVRKVYRGRITYVAHGLEEAERITFWGALDDISLSYYPALGPTATRGALEAQVQAHLRGLRRYAQRQRRPVLIAELGLRSAAGAQERPWESAEERHAAPDELVQANVLDLWLTALNQPWVSGVLVWRWLSDPQGGGGTDTDFTPQHKLAEGVLLAHWRR